MSVAKTFTLAVVTLMVAGCTGDRTLGMGPRETTGTVLGVTGGALAGSQVGGSPGTGAAGTRVAASVAGAAIGGLIGNRIGAAMDDDDKRFAYEAQMHALDDGQSGAPVSWRNPDSGRRGTIVPGPAYQQGAVTCRQYTHTIYLDGQPQSARGTACHNPDGTWTPVS